MIVMVEAKSYADEAVLDEALELLDHTAPEFGAGFANHGPMAAEALMRLDRPDAVLPWVEKYRKNLDPSPTIGTAIPVAQWRENVGHANRYPDWLATFLRLLQDEPWESVVATWVPRFFPAAIAAGTHGLIRTAHAVRALDQAPTPTRRRELAAGLAYWAASYVQLPGDPNPHGSLDVADAAQRLPLLDVTVRSHGLITDSALRVDQAPGWMTSVDLLAAPHDLETAVSELTRTFASWYLANADLIPIAFVHAVTAPAALRLLLPYVSAHQRIQAFAYVWQACAAIRTAFGDHEPIDAASTDLNAPAQINADIIAQAIDSNDEHAIKLTEACLREHRLQPAPQYVAAAGDVGSRLRQ